MKIPVGILGATGMIGQHYVSLLHTHPWFELTQLVASHPADSYEEEVKGRWHQSTAIPLGYSLSSMETLKPCKLLFSALPSPLAKKYELALLNKGYTIISSAACHRRAFPVIIPEINPHHLTSSRLITKPNCAIQSFLLPLAPLHKKAGIRSLSVTTLQAMSGGGHQEMQLNDNVIPYIPGEESKIESEPLKILEASFPISAQCNRVPVKHGHLVSVSVSFHEKLTREEILTLWRQPSPLQLPSAPKYPVVYCENPDRPQVNLDRDREGGMSVTVGRLRPCSLFDWRFVALSHNAIRGGAGGGVLIAELLKQEGYFG